MSCKLQLNEGYFNIPKKNRALFTVYKCKKCGKQYWTKKLRPMLFCEECGKI